MKKLLSLIALAGIFAACQPEEIKTAYEIANAEAAINVRVVDIRTGETPASGAVITASAGTVSGNVITISGKPAISAQTVNVTVTYKADYMTDSQSKSESVKIDALRAGGKASYDVTVVVGYTDSEYTFSLKETKEGESVKNTVYFTPSDSHAETHSHNGGVWVRNNTEFMLTGNVAWSSYNGSYATLKAGVNESYKQIVEAFAKAYNYNYENGKFVATEMEPLYLQVSAYCYYTAFQTYTKVNGTEYTVYAEKDGVVPFEIGTFVVNSIKSSSAEYEEMADPNAHGQYVQGHGHAYGADNAGGGIVISE